MSFENIKGLEITSHPKSKRLISINISQAAIDELIKKFSSIDVQDLELKPFLRFFVADECNKIFENKIKNLFKEIWIKLLEKKIVSKSLAEIENSELFKYSPYKALNAQKI